MRAGTALKVLGLFVLTVLFAVVAVIHSVDVNRYKAHIVTGMEKAIGRKVAIAGEVKLALSLSPALVMTDVAVGNAPWGSRPDMATVRRLEIQMALVPLLAGVVKVERLVLIEPDVLLETDAQGQDNWRISPHGPADGGGPVLAVTGVRLRAGKVTWRDAGGGPEGIAVIDRLTADAPHPGAPVAVSLVGRIGSTPIEAKGTVASEGGTYSVTGLDAAVGGGDFKGSVTVATRSSPPLVTALLSSSHIDLDMPPSGPAPMPADPTRLFPDDPLPMAGLKQVNADIALAVGRVTRGGSTIGDVAAKLSLKGGRLVVDLSRAEWGGGRLSGQMSVEPVGSGVAAVKVRMEGAPVDLGRVLKDAGVTGAFTGGPVELKVALSGRGDSVRSVMAALSGDARASLGPGRLDGTAVEGAGRFAQVLTAMDPRLRGQSDIEVTCGLVRLTFRDGIAATDKAIAVEATKLAAVGGGTLDLKTETLDLGLRPSRHRTANALTGVVRLRGPLAEPTVALDEAGAARTVASVVAGSMPALGQALGERVNAANGNPCLTALTGAAKPVVKSDKARKAK